MIHIINAGAALIITAASLILYKRLPARWLCEYDEFPEELHLPGFRAAGTGLQRAAVFAGVWGLVFAGLVLRSRGMRASAGVFGDGGGAFAVCLPVMILFVTAALCDGAYKILPDQLVLGAAAGAAVLRCAEAGYSAISWGGSGAAAREAVVQGLGDCGAGALAGLSVMLFSTVLGALFCGRAPFGAGDVRLMMACGAAAASFEAVLMIFCTGMLLSGLFLGAGVALGKLAPGNSIALGPFLVLAALPCL